MIKKNRLTTLMLIFTVIFITLVSCDPAKKYEKEEETLIQDYLLSNSNLSFKMQPSGLYYLTIQEGTGITPVTHDTAWIKYTGKFLNGTIFDTNVGTTDTLIRPVNEGWIIKGFDEALTLMKVGEKAMFLLPSRLAYGPSGYSIIGGFTPLLFDIELVKAKRGPVK